MEIHFNGTSGGNSFNITEDYHVFLYSTTGYKVNVSLSSGGTVINYEFFILKNGTALWAFYNGSNQTAPYASFALLSAMSGYLFENIFTDPATLAQITSSTLVHVVNQGTINVNMTSVYATTYAPIMLPLVFQTCDSSASFTNFLVQTGTVTGKPGVLLIKLEINGSFTSGGVSQNLNFEVQITSLKKT